MIAAMVSRERIRQLALALPATVEMDHHGRPSFRVDGRIFATLWDESHLNVMLDEPATAYACLRCGRHRNAVWASVRECPWSEPLESPYGRPSQFSGADIGSPPCVQ